MLFASADNVATSADVHIFIFTKFTLSVTF